MTFAAMQELYMDDAPKHRPNPLRFDSPLQVFEQRRAMEEADRDDLSGLSNSAWCQLLRAEWRTAHRTSKAVAI